MARSSATTTALSLLLALSLLTFSLAVQTQTQTRTQSIADRVHERLTSEEPFQDEQTHTAFLEEFRAQHPTRTTNKEESVLAHALHERATLFFRSIDSDHDNFVTAEDAQNAADQLAVHLPGISPQMFATFIEVADQNGDGKLSRDELIDGLVMGAASVSPAEMLEMASRSSHRARARVGFLGNVVSKVVDFGKKVVGGVTNFLKGGQGSQGPSATDESCVMCQYILERAETNVRQSGVIPSMSASPSPEGIYLELESKTGAELEATATTKDPFDLAGASVIGTTRQSTRYQRLLERQKYNEIYRIVDITLDDVCEQGMPNQYYALCKQVYAAQSDVVDGLRYQYRPADICFRIGMCAQGSYITQGIHSRYKPK